MEEDIRTERGGVGVVYTMIGWLLGAVEVAVEVRLK